jgi:D-alanine transaminase
MLVYLNGKYIPREEAVVPIDDRAFVFGDGVYEVTRVVRGRFIGEEGHWARLERGMRTLSIDASAQIDQARLREISERLLKENGLADTDATVYLQISRGAAVRTHWFPPAETAPTIFVSVSRFQIPWEQREKGARAVSHPDIRWSRCDLKTVNLLPNVLAKQHAHSAGAFEALLIRDGAVTEGSASNAFGVLDGVIRTYPRSNYILPGITRDIVLGLAADLGLRVDETPVFVDDIPDLQELFFTGTTTDVQPIVDLDGRPVGDGAPGPVATALGKALVETLGVRWGEEV